jgi:DNA-binding XRE family transcriptional regulator
VLSSLIHLFITKSAHLCLSIPIYRSLNEGASTVTDKGTIVMADPQGYGRRIRSARQDQNLSLRDLAGTVGVTAQHLSLIEREHRIPSVELAVQISDRLGLDCDGLLADAGLIPPDVLDALHEKPDLWPRVRRMARA